MEFLPSAETIAFLAKVAPAAWVKRMLLWMIYSDDLIPFFTEGRSTAKAFAFAVLAGRFGTDKSPAQLRRLIKKHYNPSLAEKLLEAAPTDEIEEIASEWSGGPQDVGAGYFVYASSIDWELGVVEADIHAPADPDEHLFWDADVLLYGELGSRADYHLRLAGLCFERDAIEMLLPTAELGPTRTLPASPQSRLGRPRIWDWDGATTHLLSIAQTPDGLPTGPGAQAEIERAISDWFVQSRGNSPAPSQVRKHAAKIMQALKSPENP